jgi:hypothetical protein
MGAPNGNGHSADVRISLFVNGLVLPVAQLGPDFLILRNAVEHAPSDAQISLSIDGAENRWTVHLVDGIHPDRLKTKTSGRIKIGE